MSVPVVIVDDEPPARAKLSRYLAEFPEFEIAAEAGDVGAAIEAVLAASPQVLFLDIQLGTSSGFDVLDAIRGRVTPHVVFTTAYSEHAVRAFELQALDYLLKPFDRERFARSMERVRGVLAEPDRGDLEERVRRLLAAIPGRPAAPAQILVRDANRAFFIATDAIERVAAAGNYVELHAGGKVHLVRETLASFAAQLDPEDFIRVHRSHVVRVGFIAELHPMFHGDYELVLRDGERLSLSRRYRALLPASIRDRL
jgi:two-component system LytT family response regulator